MVACFLKARDPASSESMEGEAGEHAYVMSVWPRCPVQCRQASEEENPFELFAETEILAEDCLGHESNSTATEPQSGGTMRHRFEDVVQMDRRKLAMTFDERSEETWIKDRPLRSQVRAENARKMKEENAKIQRRFRE